MKSLFIAIKDRLSCLFRCEPSQGGDPDNLEPLDLLAGWDGRPDSGYMFVCRWIDRFVE